jgi:hypothetical protein
MTEGHSQPEAVINESPSLVLEIADPKEPASPRFPVMIQNLSIGGVTLTVDNPWGIANWERYRGKECVLRMEAPEGQDAVTIKAQIAWTKFGDSGQPDLSLGLHLVKPPEAALKRLGRLLPHTAQDIKGLWDRYDQIQRSPAPSPLVHHCYIAGLVLLVGGLVLQFTGSPTYKMCGWVLWLLGSLGIAGKIIRPFWNKQVSND